MAKVPAHPRLPAHNARVRRWVKDFDDTTLHPILLELGYHVDLDTHTYRYNIVAIARGMARYRKGEVPGRATVFRHLARLEALGIVKPDPQYKPSGRQGITHRIVDFHQAVRFGQPVEHLWDAPVAEDETPGETPNETPGETPLLSLTISELSSDYLSGEKEASPSREIERGPGTARRDDASGICNTFIAWEVKGTGRKVAFRKDKPPRQKPPKGARVVELSPAEASFMFRCLDRDQWPVFILDPPYARASKMSALKDRDAEDRTKRDARPDAAELGRQAEEKHAAERAELEPLIQRYAELYGEDVAAVHDKIDKRGMPHSVNMTWLKSQIWRKEGL